MLLPQSSFADESPAGFATHIHALHDKILQEGRTTSQLNASDLASLPVGIYSNVGGMDYLVIIDSAVFSPQGAFFNAYISLEFKSNGKRLAFAGKDIAFHPGGLAAATESRMALVSEETLPLGEKIKLTLPNTPQDNYVAFDCNGFKSVHLNGMLEFDRTLLLPEDTEGNIAPGKLQAGFEVNSTDWGDLLASVHLPAFRIPALMGISFYVEEAVLDMSDMENPAGMVFPASYQHSYGQNVTLWEGFYLRKVRLGLFKELSTTEGRKNIYVENLILDKMGVSGEVSVSNIFGREEGSLNGWPFSVDSLGISLIKNQLRGVAFKGEMNVPLFDKDSPLQYTAIVSQKAGETEYQFVVQPGKKMKASVLAAEIELLPNSTILITKEEGKLKPEAILHGNISIRQGNKVTLNAIAFTDLHIASEQPYIRNGYWSMTGSGTQKAANFPLSINEFNFSHNERTLSLNVDAVLNLMDAKDKGFSGQTTVSITGEMEQVQETVGDAVVTRQQWKHKATTLSDIHIDADMGAFSLEGKLSMYDENLVYGDGFRGEINATFMPGPSVKAIAQFGNVNGLRYWYADAMVRLPAPTSPGFSLYGFGGGMYYHMMLERENIPQHAFITTTGNADKTTIGATRSKARYVPSDRTGLGLKASVIVGTSPSPRPFNGDVTFEIAFNNNMGLRYIRFRGEGYFMTAIEKRSSQAPLYADLDIQYDIANRALHANLDTYVNVGNTLRGIHDRGLAGTAVMHFDADKWYIWLGSPTRPLGLNFAGIAETGGYFMAGTLIEDIPDVPSEVSGILGGMDFGMHHGDAAAGGGFAFGASFRTSIGNDESGALFYGYFAAGAGFDIMMRDYGSAHCAGSTDPIGINGWYASGQAWAYLQGSIGINVKLKFIKGRFEIIKIGAASVLQAKLPNPFWMQGVVGGDFRILGGLVSGNCKFKVTIGEECEMQEGSPMGLEVIADMQPANNPQEVSVFTAPQAAFNLAVDKTFEMFDAANEYKAYRVKLDHFIVLHNNKTIPGTLEWNDQKDVLVFNPDEILPPKAEIKAEVKVVWEEKVQGIWKALNENETKSIQFHTGEAPDYIPEENIAYSYPVANQYHFLKKEYPQGYVKLKVGQPYLFTESDEDNQWKSYVRYSGPGQPAGLDVPLTYDARNKTIRYDIPDRLVNEKVYALAFVRQPQQKEEMDGNVTLVKENAVNLESARVDTETKDIQSVLTVAKEKILYESQFRTSRYNTFEEKLNAFTGFHTTGNTNDDLHIFTIGATANVTEAFDEAEVLENSGQPALIRTEALTNNAWYQQLIAPLLYAYYPVSSDLKIGWRNPDEIGVPPVKSIRIVQQNEIPSFTPETLYKNASGRSNSYVVFLDEMSYYTFKDYVELRKKALNKYLNQGYASAPKGAYLLLTKNYNDIVNGDYQFRLSYQLPGIQKVTTSKIFTIHW